MLAIAAGSLMRNFYGGPDANKAKTQRNLIFFQHVPAARLELFSATLPHDTCF